MKWTALALIILITVLGYQNCSPNPQGWRSWFGSTAPSSGSSNSTGTGQLPSGDPVISVDASGAPVDMATPGLINALGSGRSLSSSSTPVVFYKNGADLTPATYFVYPVLAVRDSATGVCPTAVMTTQFKAGGLLPGGLDIFTDYGNPGDCGAHATPTISGTADGKWLDMFYYGSDFPHPFLEQGVGSTGKGGGDDWTNWHYSIKGWDRNSLGRPGGFNSLTTVWAGKLFWTVAGILKLIHTPLPGRGTPGTANIQTDDYTVLDGAADGFLNKNWGKVPATCFAKNWAVSAAYDWSVGKLVVSNVSLALPQNTNIFYVDIGSLALPAGAFASPLLISCSSVVDPATNRLHFSIDFGYMNSQLNDDPVDGGPRAQSYFYVLSFDATSGGAVQVAYDARVQRQLRPSRYTWDDLNTGRPLFLMASESGALSFWSSGMAKAKDLGIPPLSLPPVGSLFSKINTGHSMFTFSAEGSRYMYFLGSSESTNNATIFKYSVR